jgi:hypothetical protein
MTFASSLDLTESEKRRVSEFLAALRSPCIVTQNKDSYLVSDAFENEFRSRLLANHCFIGSPLFQESFDSAFIAASEFAGFQVARAPEGQRFWDVSINDKRISLKSSKAKSLKAGTLHISKLTEAAWIQDCRTAAKRQELTLELFREYTATVDSIIQLRFFQPSLLYELVEIPVQLFSQISTIDRSLFAADGPSIDIPVGKHPPDFCLKLDRSDAKVTLSKINKHLCTVHCTWCLAQE